VEKLFAWWAIHKREFPWRVTSDPFRLLVAEMLLQRSRSTSVGKVYITLFETWPNPEDIRDADITDIESVIRTLGLTGRAKRVKDMANAWLSLDSPPKNSLELRSLPGVGAYAANATAVVMGWDTEACVDSVSARVLRRVSGNSDNGESDAEMASEFYGQIESSKWRDLNWAILDLAALVCLPKYPRCLSCPINNDCEWNKNNNRMPCYDD